MATIRLDRVSFAHSDSVPLLVDTRHVFDPGWTGLVGANGSGKTTLLRLIAGDLAPESGCVLRTPQEATLALCPQQVTVAAPAIHDFAGRWDRDAIRLQGRLALDPADLARWSTLSPGERKRWQIGAALAGEPEVLLLDEPTNHLDAEGRELLLRALKSFTGVGIVVSHDRRLLAELTTATLRLHQGSADACPLPYDQAREIWQAEEGQRRDAHARLRREAKKMCRRVADKQRQQAAAGRGVGRHVSPRDHDARSVNVRNRRQVAAERLGRQVTVARRSLERIESQAADFRFDKARGRALAFQSERAAKGRLATLAEPLLRAGDRTLLADLHLRVERSTRLWIDGANGSGKSTLLQALVAAAQLPAERLLYLPQELPAGHVAERLEALRALPEDERGQVLEIVAALGIDPTRLLATRNPSPGEARKLELAWGLGRRAWLLVLDEPTNHLDLPSIERLQTALEAYPGALVLVSHDRPLAAAVTDESWCITGGRLEPRVGGRAARG